MPIARLDAADSGTTDNQSYSVSSGSNRCLSIFKFNLPLRLVFVARSGIFAFGIGVY